MSDEAKTVEAVLGGKALAPDQWYAVQVKTFARRSATGKLETKGFTMNAVKVDSPDAPMPPEGGGEVPPGEATPKPV